MSQKVVRVIGIALALLLSAASVQAQKASQKEIDELKRALEAQEKSIQQLKTRINDLEGEKRPAAVAPAPAAPAAEEAKPAITSPAEVMEAKMAATEGRQSPVEYRGNFDDKQEAVARPSDYLLDSQYRGFIPIPRTVFMIKFNPKPRVDMTLDSDNSGDDFRFVPARIPLDGTPEHGGGVHFNANSNGSQLRLDMRAPTLKGNFRFYYQNDFFGSDSKNMQYRLQHLYGQYYGFVGGFTYGVFEDPDAWPDTLDYEGPNSVIFARRPLLHYTFDLADAWSLTLGLEDPDTFIDTTVNGDVNGPSGGSKRFRAPDGGFNVRWEPGKLGHIQASTIMRSIGIDGDAVSSDDVFGWGINLAGSINATPDDTIQSWIVYGHGVGGMGNDTSFVNSDAALKSNGDLVALQYFSALLGYSHNWSPRWRSTATYGYADLQNTGMQAADAYNYTHYASLNLVYKIFTRFSVGAEGLYGFRQAKSGDDGDVFRFQVSMLYSVFD